MRELTRYWSVRGIRRSFFIRGWWHGNPLRSLVRWLAGYEPWRTSSPVKVDLHGLSGHQCGCYCPTGRTTTFRVELFGVGFWGQLSRNWTVRPCSCDKISWLCFPENYAEEIEEYGLEKLQAEFPGVKPV